MQLFYQTILTLKPYFTHLASEWLVHVDAVGSTRINRLEKVFESALWCEAEAFPSSSMCTVHTLGHHVCLIVCLTGPSVTFIQEIVIMFVCCIDLF